MAEKYPGIIDVIETLEPPYEPLEDVGIVGEYLVGRNIATAISSFGFWVVGTMVYVGTSLLRSQRK